MVSETNFEESGKEFLEIDILLKREIGVFDNVYPENKFYKLMGSELEDILSKFSSKDVVGTKFVIDDFAVAESSISPVRTQAYAEKHCNEVWLKRHRARARRLWVLGTLARIKQLEAQKEAA